MLGKVLALGKRLYNWIMDTEEVEVKSVEVKPSRKWEEYAEQLQMIERAEAYEEEQARLAAEKERQALKEWRENNRAVSAYFNKQNKRMKKERLHVVA